MRFIITVSTLLKLVISSRTKVLNLNVTKLVLNCLVMGMLNVAGVTFSTKQDVLECVCL